MRSSRQRLALLLVLAAVPALAQTSRGRVSGLVPDPQQLAVPGWAVEHPRIECFACASVRTITLGRLVLPRGCQRTIARIQGLRHTSLAWASAAGLGANRQINFHFRFET